MLKRIEAVVRRERLCEVKHALDALPHQGFTAYDTTDYDPSGGATIVCRGRSFAHDMTPKASVSVLVDASDARAVVEAIATAAHTGRDGDGTIVVVPVEEALSISDVSAVA